MDKPVDAAMACGEGGPCCLLPQLWPGAPPAADQWRLDKYDKTLGDAWQLSVTTGTWREVGQS